MMLLISISNGENLQIISFYIISTEVNFLQSPEEARSFLQRSTEKYGINYVLFMEECCLEGCCRLEEIMEHCLPSLKK